ncbi:glycosyltransferase family 2 protein [Nodosilinea nodulosa]|uniref:glycosyltransferase family 2 protein n=1 Tax=Nodosilinea nodulosa TaxID=416001 RepID=UPI000365299D|nr:glycosyltransferase family 2 protein [Nodosilinea nodulosa]
MVSFSRLGHSLRSSEGNRDGADAVSTDGVSGSAVAVPSPDRPGPGRDATRPLVSLVVPAFNEAALLTQNLTRLCDYMAALESSYRWELIVVNDGSFDDTAAVAEQFARGKRQVQVLHHLVNGGLGQALQSGVGVSRGDYVVTLDLDLSYAPEHVEHLLTHLRRTQAKVVVASPYMTGGQVSNVPWLRRKLSLWANRFLAVTAKRQVSTLTGLVRAYDGDFVRSLSLLSPGMEVNPEILHKAMLLHERIEEVPAHLCWSSQRQQRAIKKPQRRSSMKILGHTWSMFFFGFLFRPVIFFVLPSLAFFGLAIGLSLHGLLAYLGSLRSLSPQETALGLGGGMFPHSYLLAGMALMLAIQLFGMGLLAVQNKRYFEEMFYLGMTARRRSQSGQGDQGDSHAETVCDRPND